MIQLSRRTIMIALVAFVAFAGLATASFVRTLAPAEAGASFSDTPPWIATHAAWLANNGIANGFPDNTFRPSDNITRGQAAFWFSNFNDTIHVIGDTTNPAANSVFTISTTCEPGDRAVAGGGRTDVGNTYMTDSYANLAGAGDGGTWHVRWETENNVVADPSLLEIWVLCVPNTIP
jgi:hypothetical protein